MGVYNLTGLLAATTGGALRVPFTNPFLAATAGIEYSFWRSGGFPPQGAIPTAAAVCNNTTVGAIPVIYDAIYIDKMLTSVATKLDEAGSSIIVYDRLMHMGGLNGTLLTAQTVGVDLHANLGVNNLSSRIRYGDYSEVEWYVEWYVSTGSLRPTPVFNVTFHDGTTGTVNCHYLGDIRWGAGMSAQERLKLFTTNGKFIRSVETVTLDISTGTVGNFGVTAVVNKAYVNQHLPRQLVNSDIWALNAPPIINESCITLAGVMAPGNSFQPFSGIVTFGG